MNIFECDMRDRTIDKNDVLELIDFLTTKEDEIHIKGIPSAEFCAYFNIYPDDEWGHDWVSTLELNNHVYSVNGNDWFGTITIYLLEE